MESPALSLQEFRDLTATFEAPQLWTSDPTTHRPLPLPEQIVDCGAAFVSPGLRFSDSVSPADRGEYARLAAEGTRKSVSEAQLRFLDGMVRQTLKIRARVPELIMVTVTNAIGTHDLAVDQVAPAPSSGRFREAGVLQVDGMANILTADAGCCSILRLDPDDPAGPFPVERIHPADLGITSALIAEAMERPEALTHKQVRIGSAEEGWRIVEWLIVLIDPQTANPRALISMLDMHDDVVASTRADEDELTGLLNRSGFQAELEQVEVPSALVFIDIDRFKEINDGFGHAVGDEVLKNVALRLKGALRNDEGLGRIHGDEFVALIPRIESPAVAHQIAQRLVAALDEPIEVDGQRFTLTASAGHTLLVPGQSVAEVMHRADVAMYEAKQRSGSQVAPFEDELIVRREVRNRGIGLLPTVFAPNSGLFFEFQPVVRTDTCKVLGIEALLRWELDDGTRIPPPDALSLFEAHGRMEAFTLWSIRRVAETIEAMNSWPGNRLQVGLNLSPTQLAMPDLSSWLTDAMVPAGIETRRVVIEVTETEALSDNRAAYEAACSLIDRGFQLSLDDFGAGWSSLDQLAATPANSLKIDRRLVEKIDNPRVGTVLRSLKAISDEFGMMMVAEGVETPEQLLFFHDLGAAAIQGWLFGRSVPFKDLLAAISTAEQIAEQHLRAVPAGSYALTR